MTPAIEQLFSSFASNLVNLVRAEMRAEVATVLGDGVHETAAIKPPIHLASLHRAAKQLHALNDEPTGSKARKKGPIQLCPSPGCKERAAPSLRMLCKKHAGTPKIVVAKWREARRKKLESKKAA